jgi:hypothetical protein
MQCHMIGIVTPISRDTVSMQFYMTAMQCYVTGTVKRIALETVSVRCYMTGTATLIALSLSVHSYFTPIHICFLMYF